MLNWIANALGGMPDTPSADDGTSLWLGKIERMVEDPASNPRQVWPAGFAARVVAHLATGNDNAILAESATLAQVASQHGDISDLYAGFDQVAPEVALRWAKLLAAAWSQSHGGYDLELANGSHWAECLMLHASNESPNSYRYGGHKPPRTGYLARHLEALLVADGLAPQSLLVASFAGFASASGWASRGFTLIARAADYADAVDRHLESLRSAFADPQVQHRLHVLKMVDGLPASILQRLGVELADFSVSNSKQVREAVREPARLAGAAIVEPLRRWALEGKPEERAHALQRLDELARDLSDDSLAAFARSTAAADKAPSVRNLFKHMTTDADKANQAPAPRDYAVTVPQIDWSAATNAVDPATLAAFWQLVDASIAKTNRNWREIHARYARQGDPYQMVPYSAQDKAGLAACLASSDITPTTGPAVDGNRVHHVRGCIAQIAPRLTPVAAWRMLAWFKLVAGDRDGSALGGAAASVFNAMHAATGRPSLLELATLLSQAGVAPIHVLRSYCRSNANELAHQWDDEAVWPFFAQHATELEQLLLSPPRNDWYHDPARVFQAIETLPWPPASVVDALFKLALGSAKTDRAPAQAALANHPGKEERIAAALADGKAEVRQLAADWLGRLRHAPALAALEQACAKEKNDVAKGAMLDALQALGQPVEKYIDRAAIARDAPKALAKGLPKEIEWFPWAALPVVRWADSGEPVPADVLRWLLVQSFKQKSPEPNAVLRKLCGLMDARDREAFGQLVLEAWLAEDVKAIAPDVAHSSAMHQAQSTFRMMASHPQYYTDSPQLGKSVDELYAYFLPGMQRQPAGSAISSKGLLAVAAACAGERAAAPVQRYLKLWYGTRAAQGKALIAMLAWIEHPSATQLMLAVGSRFRTKSFQEEATKQAEALADRKGWTLSELADRTIPSAGFDQTGTLELSYGERRFSAHLLPDFKVELFNPDGKKIAALPEPRQDDDAEAAKESKKALAAARKDIKSIVSLQTDRLYEALCTERDWPATDWRDYLLAHPVMRQLVQRLVWTWTTEDGTMQTFRPLDDGTLTSSGDDALTLPPAARVRIAHDSSLPADEARAWQQHLVDYAVRPLFTQFGKGSYKLPAERARDTVLKDFEGHLIEAFSLRGRATKLGYARGPTGDGGWFHSYDKRFPTLGLQAVIRFTGNALPESNRTVALESLSFERTGKDDGGNAATSLDKVPAVLLSECMDDMRLIASEGTGFDADWRKKSEL
jgi:hypothetical protein